MSGIPDTVTGVRHVITHAPEHDGTTGFYSECRCGCQQTDGLEGRVIEVVPELDLLVAEFTIPSLTGGEPRQAKTAFSLTELPKLQASPA